jgi:hypothetical protein
MKKHLLLLSLLIIGLNDYSQDYHKLIRTGAYWDQYTVVLPEWCYTTITRYSFTNIDTVLGGHTYRINKCYPFKAISSWPMCPPFVIDTISFISGSFFREDTINRKVYKYCPDCQQKDELFYDFSLSVGDTLKSEEQTLYGEPLVLTSIDTVTLLNGEKRKQYGFANSPATINYVESIGGDQGLDVSIVPGFEWYGGFLCLSQNGINLWGRSCDNYFVGMNEKNTDEVKIYPNPAHEIVNIHLPGDIQNAEFTILDTRGNEIVAVKLNQQMNVLSISQIVPGFYIYKIKSNTFSDQGKLVIY